MNCSEVRRKLAAFTDGGLETEAKELVSLHLDSCPGCREELAQLQRLDSELDLLPDVEVKPYFATRLHQRIADRNRRGALGWARRVAVPAGAAVVMLLAAVAGTQLGRGLYGRRTLSTSQSTTVASPTSTLDLLDGPGGSFYVAGGQ